MHITDTKYLYTLACEKRFFLAVHFYLHKGPSPDHRNVNKTKVQSA